MVSALWKASSDGDLDQVIALLNDPALVDLEIKDPAGATPLLEAVKNGHTEVVRVLLDKGADPTNSFSQGPPEQYTSDPNILNLLATAKSRLLPQGMSSDTGYPQDMGIDAAKGYYPPPPPPGPYYYPGMPLPPPMMPEGGVAYYPPLPPPHHFADHSGSGSNLPPPEIARMIPCRYYPACRYGATCMFAHPQAPYMQGPMPPPAQYPPPFDPMSPSHYPPYYPVPPPSFQVPTNGPSGAISPTLSPSVAPLGAPHPPPMMHGSSPSDLSAPGPPPFNGAPPPSVPYGVVPPQYGPPVPVAIPSHSPISGPHSPQQAIYPPTSPLAPGPSQYPVPPSVGYAHQGVIVNGNHHDPATLPKSPTVPPQSDPYIHSPRETYGHQRRGSARRPSFGIGRKPPCLFFPAGRCKNGDDCRFPHVLPDGSSPHHPPPFIPRGGHRQRPSVHTNGFNGLEDRFANLTTHDQPELVINAQPVAEVPGGGNMSNGSSRSQSTEPSARPRGPSGYNKANQYVNGYRNDRRHIPVKPQRVPSADEFPVLSGSSTPPLRSPGIIPANGWSGPTAAQVLQAPPPPRKDSQPSTRGASPANGRSGQASKDESKAEPNGAVAPTPQISSKLPVSFAAVAAPEVAKDVAVSA